MPQVLFGRRWPSPEEYAESGAASCSLDYGLCTTGDATIHGLAEGLGPGSRAALRSTHHGIPMVDHEVEGSFTRRSGRAQQICHQVWCPPRRDPGAGQ